MEEWGKCHSLALIPHLLPLQAMRPPKTEPRQIKRFKEKTVKIRTLLLIGISQQTADFLVVISLQSLKF